MPTVQHVTIISKQVEEYVTSSFKKSLDPGTNVSKALYRSCPATLEGLYQRVTTYIKQEEAPQPNDLHSQNKL